MGIEDNKAVVREWVEGWNVRGEEAVDDLFAPDFTDRQLEQRLGEPVTLESFKQSLRAVRSALGECRFEEREMIAEGDRVLIRWSMRGTHTGPYLGLPATGRPFVLDGINIFRIEQGRIAERWTLIDVPGLLSQLGATVVPVRAGPLSAAPFHRWTTKGSTR